MTKDDVAEYIGEKMDEQVTLTGEDFEGRKCCYCGTMVPFDDLVTWDIQVEDSEDLIARHYFCSDDCKRESVYDEQFNNGTKTYHGQWDEIPKEAIERER